MLQKRGSTHENYGTSGDKVLHSKRLWGIFTKIFSACETICVNPDLSVTKSLISVIQRVIFMCRKQEYSTLLHDLIVTVTLSLMYPIQDQIEKSNITEMLKGLIFS